MDPAGPTENGWTDVDVSGSAPAAVLSPPLTPGVPATPRTTPGFTPLVTVVGFHHARGPEVETWFGVPEGFDPAVTYDWSLLPFQALSDGAHASSEDFSYFTLLRPGTNEEPATSLFGISCTRQLDSSQLLNRPDDVTRSTVQKAVVVIADSPQFFGMLRERLSMVTCAWFAQREFTDVEILRRFQESLAEDQKRGLLSEEVDRDQYLGLSLRELIREYRWQTLVLLKCCLLQRKMLFFGSKCEQLCMIQFSLISLIPGLLRNLQDCASPELNSYAEHLRMATGIRSSDRNSLLAYLGMPLQLFCKGSLFGPYTPLQQLDILADHETKSYIVGSTNSLLLQQRDRYSDILVNLDDNSITIGNPSLKAALALSASDRRWIDFITQEVNDTWDEANPSRPKGMGYAGSEEFIRLQFEEYLLKMVASVKYHHFIQKHPHQADPDIEGDPSSDFGTEWVDQWTKTENYKLWNRNTDTHIWHFTEPKHPCAGGLTIEDVQRRLAQQVQDLHLDERFAQGKEVLGQNLAAGKEKANKLLGKLYADLETYREANKRKAEEAKAAAPPQSSLASPGPLTSPAPSTNGFSGVDLSKAQQAVQSAGGKASAYFNSWATWAGEKRKQGWGRSNNTATQQQSTNGGGGGWGLGGYGRKKHHDEKYGLTSSGRRSEESMTSSKKEKEEAEQKRPMTQESFDESILGSEDGTTGALSGMASPVKSEASPPPKKEGTDQVVEETEKPNGTQEKTVQEDEGKVGSKVVLIRESPKEDAEGDEQKTNQSVSPQDEGTKVWAA